MMEAALLLLGTQLLCCWSASILPVRPSPFQSLPCNDPAAATAADMAICQINADRREGYIFSLYRISDVQEHFQESAGVVYYLTLDVLETVCHVLSRRAWETCEVKPIHLVVFGKCKATLHINRPRRIAHLYNYECTLSPVPQSQIQRTCPDCPIPGGPDNPKYLESAQLSLDKFNKESNLTKYLALDSITQSSMQRAVGALYFVEFTVRETNCTKEATVVDVSKCPPLSCEFAHTGFCKGSVVYIERQATLVSGSCDIYEPEAAVAEEEKHKDSEEEHSDHDHKEAYDHHHHHGHEHDHKHGDIHDPDDKHDHDDEHDHDHDHAHHHEHNHNHDDDHDDDHDHDHDHDHNHEHNHDHENHHQHNHHHHHDHAHHHHHDHDHNNQHNHTHEHDDAQEHNNTHHHGNAHEHVHSNEHNHTHHHDQTHEHGHEHDHKHLHAHEHHHHSSPDTQGAKSMRKTAGVVRILPFKGVSSATATADDKSASPKADKPVLIPTFLDHRGSSKVAGPVPLTWFPNEPADHGKQPPAGPFAPRNPFDEPTILPFPKVSSNSKLCPGEPKNNVSLVDTLLKNYQ